MRDPLLRIKFFYGPLDGAEVTDRTLRSEDLPSTLVLPRDDQWDLWKGAEVSYMLSHIRSVPTGREVHFTLSQAVPA